MKILILALSTFIPAFAATAFNLSEFCTPGNTAAQNAAAMECSTLNSTFANSTPVATNDDKNQSGWMSSISDPTFSVNMVIAPQQTLATTKSTITPADLSLPNNNGIAGTGPAVVTEGVTQSVTPGITDGGVTPVAPTVASTDPTAASSSAAVGSIPGSSSEGPIMVLPAPDPVALADEATPEVSSLSLIGAGLVFLSLIGTSTRRRKRVRSL
jgi:hypothetical protein